MRQFLNDNLTDKLEIEAIKKRLINQDKNIELVFSYLDELIEKQEKKLKEIKLVIKNKLK